MMRFLRTALACMLVLALGTVVRADQAAPVADAPPVCSGTDLVDQAERSDPSIARAIDEATSQLPNVQGLLWKVEKPGLPVSYLFGTMHVTDPDAVAIARSTAPYLAEVRTVATELGELNPALKAMAAVKAGIRALKSTTDMASLIPAPEDRTAVGALVKPLGIDPDTALRMPPWMFMSLVAVPPCEVERQRHDLPIVDSIVASLGVGAGAKVVGLETIDDQLDAMELLDAGLAARMVLFLARKPGSADDMFATMVALYRQHRAGGAIPAIEIAGRMSAEEVAADRAFLVTIVEKRNLVMRSRAEALMEAGPVFVAVGALHLVGPNGLVELFRRDGYAVTRVW